MRRSVFDTQQLLDLTRVNSVRIEQRVEALEMFTGIEGANAYDVMDPEGNVIAHAAESTGGMHRVILGSSRLESIELRTAAGEPVLSLKESWGFPFSTHRITDPAGQPLFQIKQRFAFFSRKFAIWGEGSPDIRIKGPLFRPWTFWVYEDEKQVGKITKRFSGIGREMVTDADKFDVEFTSPIAHQEQRMRMLVMAFVLDMKYFEGKSNHGGGLRFGS